ncbi:hypothetical protein D920_00558 [Enterococcus faecalis 13-SD-W-01]|nr:hypothetical protein D920_00558 [Enterococcus faecalis 13-SD-W-01]
MECLFCSFSVSASVFRKSNWMQEIGILEIANSFLNRKMEVKN